MFSLHVFWLSSPWSRYGRESNNELHAIISNSQSRLDFEHVRSPRMESVTRYIASQIWATDQEFAACAIEFPRRLHEHLTFSPPDSREDLRRGARTLTDEEQQEFVNLISKHLKFGQRLPS